MVYEIENIFLANNYIDSYKFGNRAPLNSAYSVLISEYGIFFYSLLFYFHGKSYRLLTIFDLLEMTLIMYLFLNFLLLFHIYGYHRLVTEENNLTN